MIRIITGDCLDVLPTLAAESVHCVVTSPPYWGLRDYGVDGQLGLEKTPEEYVDNLVAIFCQVRRVLRGDGTVFLNLGDSYFGDSPTRKRSSEAFSETWDKSQTRSRGGLRRSAASVDGLKPKDLCGIPWRVAFALQSDGWWLRSDIIWEKPNCMPESVTDRPTKSHEYVFLLSKSARYFYDADAVREPHSRDWWNETVGPEYMTAQDGRNDGGKRKGSGNPNGRNRRTVWTIPTRAYKEAHFATFAPALVEPCIKAGTSERGCCPECGAPWERVVETTRTKDPIRHTGRAAGGNNDRRDGDWPRMITETTTKGWQPTCTCFGHFEDVDDGEDWITEETGKRRTKRVYVPDDSQPDPIPCTVLDPFSGAGTVGLVADRLGRDAILIELKPDYAEMARQRIVGDAPMLVDVRMEPPESRSCEI